MTVAPVPVSLAVPREAAVAVFEPDVNVTEPVGPAVPLVAFTVTVRTVEAVDASVVGLALSVAVVAVSGEPMVTVTVPLELLKEPEAA